MVAVRANGSDVTEGLLTLREGTYDETPQGVSRPDSSTVFPSGTGTLPGKSSGQLPVSIGPELTHATPSCLRTWALPTRGTHRPLRCARVGATWAAVAANAGHSGRLGLDLAEHDRGAVRLDPNVSGPCVTRRGEPASCWNALPPACTSRMRTTYRSPWTSISSSYQCAGSRTGPGVNCCSAGSGTPLMTCPAGMS
jgi:hypothetical protein